MKRTIITLLALAGVAYAEVTRNTKWGNADVEVRNESSITLSSIIDGILTENGVADEWTDVALDGGKINNGSLKFLDYTERDSLTLGVDRTVSLWAMEMLNPGTISMNFSNGASLYTTPENATQLGGGQHVSYGINCYNGGISVSVTLTSTQLETMKAEKTLSYTLISTGESWNYNYCGNNTDNTVTWKLRDNDQLSQLGYTNKGVVENAGVLSDNSYGIIVGAKGATFVAKGLVPKPTTATLSLLALAGLALRRRR